MFDYLAAFSYNTFGMNLPCHSSLGFRVGLSIWATLAVLCVFCASPLCRAANERPVVVVPLDGEIEDGLVYVVRRALRLAEQNQARAVILHMDTPGGKVTAMEKIMQELAHAPLPVYTYVDTKALSAGAMIAAATRAIYMAPQSQIGAAMLIQMPALPLGAPPQSLDEGVRAKMLSAYRAMVRSACERNGHRWDLFEAMMDPDIAISNLVEKGALLTLTAQEAVTQRLARAIATSIPHVLELLEMRDAPVIRVKPTGAEQLARFLTSSIVSGLLLALGLAGLFIELRTPGFGLPGTIGLVCLALFFWGHIIAGMSGWLEVALFLIGVILLLVEILLIPGFGITGIIGIILIVAALVLAMLEWSPGQGFPASSQLFKPVVVVASAFLASIILMVLVARLFPRTPGVSRMFLTYSLERAKAPSTATAPSANTLEGKTGVAKTILRPAGKALIDNVVYDVITDGEFIPAGTPIRVTSCSGNRIVVHPLTSSPAAS
ncbi:MAG: ATP-dependent Clp protease proteolytic subunit [bacterium]|nr:ATP-dependent Clp protease proteolytic subunit [bacterium]